MSARTQKKCTMIRSDSIHESRKGEIKQNRNKGGRWGKIRARARQGRSQVM